MTTLGKPFWVGLSIGAFVAIGFASLLYGMSDFFVVVVCTFVLSYGFAKGKVLGAQRMEHPARYWTAMVLCTLMVAASTYRAFDRFGDMSF